jgi:hypothetical protein
MNIARGRAEERTLDGVIHVHASLHKQSILTEYFCTEEVLCLRRRRERDDRRRTRQRQHEEEVNRLFLFVQPSYTAISRTMGMRENEFLFGTSELPRGVWREWTPRGSVD